jgi:ribonuclease P protein component
VALNSARLPAPTPVRRLVHKADFVRLLDVYAKERSAHFAVHHVASAPQGLVRVAAETGSTVLSTAVEQLSPRAVDNSPAAVWIGCVVPKRHARRAVTRNLLKRQIRQAFERHAAGLPRGIWLVRLRTAFAPRQFVSAASPALLQAARQELDALLARSTAAAGLTAASVSA